MKDFLKINPADNVAVAINPLAEGTVVSVEGAGDRKSTRLNSSH